MGVFKKIVKSKDFKWLLIMQLIVVILIIFVFSLGQKPVSQFEKYSIRIYSPSVRLEKYDTTLFDKSDTQVLKIISGEYELVYSDVKGRNKFSDPPIIEQLSDEKYLDAIYIITEKNYKIVELHGETKTYYTIEDHISQDTVNFIWTLIPAILIELGYIFIATIFVDEILHGPRKFKPRQRLFKKHPANEHAYTDEENEFSPYKQKLLDKDREEDANSD